MKFRRRKKVLSCVLATVMVLTCLPDYSAAAMNKNQEASLQSQSLQETYSEAEIEALSAEVFEEQEIFGVGEQEPLPEQGIVQGKCGENVSYELNTDTGEMVISGSGAMADYESATDSPFYQYGDIITSVEVTEGITSIGTLSFAFCFGVERVYLPNTLESIGNQAFLGCVSLQALVVPETVANIGDYALGYYCNNGKEGTYQKTGLNIIGISGSAVATYAQEKEQTFIAADEFTHYCGENAAWEVDIKTGVLKISGEGIMSDYTVSNYNGTRPEYYPYRDYITSVVVETGITAIGKEVFYNFEKLKHVDIANSVEVIGQSVFSYCGNMEGILLPESLTTIGQYAFSDCYSLKSITIPEGVSEIGTNVFSGCSQLEKIEVAEDNPFFLSNQGVLFDKEQKNLIVFPKGCKAASFIVPDTVKFLGQYAFSGGSSLKNLIFEGDAPSGLQSNRQKIDGLTIYYLSSRQSWDSMVSALETANVDMKDMSELINQNTLLINEESQQLSVGQSIQLTTQISPYLATEFLWSSSNEGVAVVSGQGKVTAVNPGSTEIQVTSADGQYTAKMSISVTGEQFTMPDYDIEVLEEGINYTSIFVPTKQIISENLHGIYFLEKNKLGFYSFVDKSYREVETFEGCDDAYAANGMLYVLYKNTCYIYDLSVQSMKSWFEIGGYKAVAVGADAQGRIYISGCSKYNLKKQVVLLFSEDGKMLSELPVGTNVYAFSGFDSSNGHFYMESYYDYYSWGYSHPGIGLTMGKTDGNRLRYIDTYYSFRESGMISRGMSCLLFLCQDAYMEHQTSAELIGDRYLTAASVLHGIVSVYDSHSASSGGISRLMNISRSAIDEDGEKGYYDISSIGVRTVYNERNNSILIYENNKTISEYSLITGEKLSDFETQHKVFNMLKMGDSLIVIEKENNAYYMEILDWGVPAEIQIRTEHTQMQVGSSQTLTLESDKKYNSHCRWSSSDSSIVSVTGEGRAAAWKEGTAVITAEISESLKVDITITVTASGILTPEENIIRKEGELSENCSANDYRVYGKTVKSYLAENDNQTITRVEYIPEKGVLAETYSKEYEMLESKVIPCELSYFGGYYSGRDANFLVFGEKNEAESDQAEVLRIVKYSKEWERKGEVSVKGANTYIPFDAGSLRMAETGNLLYIYTCHEMYASGDSAHHQANMTFVVNEETMEIAQSYYGVLNIAQAGYVSHSFNQFIQTDGTYVFRVDHGDANPRAVSLTRCNVDGDITNISYILPFPISGTQGNNATGASIGGFELSSDNCLIVGNSIDQGSYSYNGQRNIFVTVTGKELDAGNTVWLTDYTSDSDIMPRTPYIVKLSQEQFLVLWEEYSSQSEKTRVKMVTIDSEGNKTSEIVETGLRLSDCAPVITSDGLVKWYVTDSKSVNFCVVNPYNLSAVKGEFTDTEQVSCEHVWDEGTVTVAATCIKEGIKTFTCTECGTIRTEIMALDSNNHAFTWTSDVTGHWKECECGEKIEAAEHIYGWVIDKPATEETTGIKHEECSICGNKRNENTIIGKIPVGHTHKYDTIWKNDVENHWKECECGEIAKEEHTFGEWTTTKEATCSDIGIQSHECTVCGYNETQEISVSGHTLNKVASVLATCTLEGNIEYYVCSNCNKCFADSEATKEIFHSDITISKTTHSYKSYITKATLKKNGSIVQKCSNCGEEKSRTVIYAVRDITLSKTSYTYNGKVRKPVVTIKDSKGRVLKEKTDYTVLMPKGMKNVGRYTVTITFKGNYKGIEKKTFDIVPKGTSISKVTAKKGGFTVKWKKQSSQTTGYEIVYSTSSKFVKKYTKTAMVKKSSITSKSISKLKAKKKYYVRIRTYKTVKANGKTVKLYSGWSKAKTVVIKK